MRVSMVCLGNICRSPMAEAVARAMAAAAGLGGTVTVDSYGTAGYHVGDGADPRAVAALARRGWPMGDHRARRLTAAELDGIDLVLCADRANLAAVRRLAPHHGARVRLLRSFDPEASDDEVPDPWDGDDRAFDEALELIEAACRGLVGQLAGEGR